MQTDMNCLLWCFKCKVYVSMVHFDLGNLDGSKCPCWQAVEVAQTNRGKRDWRICMASMDGLSARMEGSQLSKGGGVLSHRMKIRRNWRSNLTLLWAFFSSASFMAHAAERRIPENLKQAESLFQEMGINYWLGRQRKSWNFKNVRKVPNPGSVN